MKCDECEYDYQTEGAVSQICMSDPSEPGLHLVRYQLCGICAQRVIGQFHQIKNYHFVAGSQAERAYKLAMKERKDESA